MKKLNLSLFILLLNAGLVKSQIISTAPTQVSIAPFTKKADYRIPIIKALGRHWKSTLFESPKNHAYVFTISLAFNAEGKIDTIYFSDKMSKKLNEIIEPSSSLSKKLGAIDFKGEFINKLVLLPIVVKRYDAQEIDNASDFLNEFMAFWPKLDGADKTKELVLLDPFINLYFPPIR